MNKGLSVFTLRGRVLDVGGGHAPDYFNYFKTEPDAHVETIDGSTQTVDFEKDALPYPDNSIDTIILCNVLEHVYAYQFLLNEVRRVLKPDGQLIGFVPFLIQYHPDPHDYFRYTHEALARIFDDSGFKNVKITRVGGGPFLANFNNLVLSLPRVLRAPLYLPYALLDAAFVRLRSRVTMRYPLGFIFSSDGSHHAIPR
jgi:SAM-dependent methyltransferase